MLERGSAEEYLAKLEDILRRYRIGMAEANVSEKLSQEEALALLRKLGFTAGEALSLLRTKGIR